MKLGRVTGSITATAKDPALSGLSMLVVDIVDASGDVLEPGLVAVDRVGAGPDDLVLVTTGSAVRTAHGLAMVPADAAIIAIIDDLNTGSSSGKR